MLRYEFTLGIYTPTSREYIRIYTPREGMEIAVKLIVLRGKNYVKFL